MSEKSGAFRSGGLGGRDRRAIRWGLAAAATVLVVVLGVQPYARSLGENRDRLAAERAVVARERAAVADSTRRPGDRARMSEALSQRAPRLFPGDPALAAGALVRYVAEQAAASHVHLEGAETAGTEEPGPGVVGVQVRIRAVGDVAGILELIRRLEDGPRLVRLERLSLERRESYPDPAGRGSGEEVQVVVLGATVVGYTLAAQEGDG